MYNFIFIVIYIQQIEKKRSETFARYNGSLIVSFTLGLHLLLIAAIIKKIQKYYFDVDFYFENKSILILFALILFTLTFRYYSKNKTQIIQDKYAPKRKYILNSKNIAKVIVIIFLPLFLIVLLAKK